jgi:DNA-binding transcriptional ArsR family regulator
MLESMLDKILGSSVAQKAFLYLHHHGEGHASAIARTFKVSLSTVQSQLTRFEDAGVIISKVVGRTRLYTFNSKSKVAKLVEEIVKTYYDKIPVAEKSKIFSTRTRPRRAGKPVIGRK